MSGCPQTGPFGIGDLVCTRDEHADKGHTFAADWAPDGHTDEVNEAFT